jgi:hypothetical protein
MQYHVGRNGQQFGQFTEDAIRQGLAAGQFLGSDLVWREGMPQWKPLTEVFGFAAAAALSAPMVSHGGVITPSVYPQPGVGMGAYQHTGVAVMPMSAMAIVSMILGILALLSYVACFIGAVLGIPGIICGHMSLAEIRRSGGQLQGKGMAIAGLITSYVAVGIGVAVMLFILIFVGIGAAGAAARGGIK